MHGFLTQIQRLSGRSQGVVTEQGNLSQTTASASPNTLAVWFIGNSAPFSVATNAPTGRMAPANFSASVIHFQRNTNDLWVENNSGVQYAGFSPLRSRITWSFGDSGNLLVADPDPLSLRSTNADASEDQQGYTAAYIYDTPGTYTMTCTITNESGTNWSYSTNIVVSTNTRTQYYVDSSNGSDANAGTATNAAWQSISNAFTSPGSVADVQINLRRSQQFNTTSALTFGGSNWLVDSWGSGAIPIVHKQGVNGTDLFITAQATPHCGIRNVRLTCDSGLVNGRGNSINQVHILVNSQTANTFMQDVRVVSPSTNTSFGTWSAVLQQIGNYSGGSENNNPRGTTMVNVLDTGTNRIQTIQEHYRVQYSYGLNLLGCRFGNSPNERPIRILGNSFSGAYDETTMGVKLEWIDMDMYDEDYNAQNKDIRIQGCQWWTLAESKLYGKVQLSFGGGHCRYGVVDASYYYFQGDTNTDTRGQLLWGLEPFDITLRNCIFDGSATTNNRATPISGEQNDSQLNWPASNKFRTNIEFVNCIFSMRSRAGYSQDTYPTATIAQPLSWGSTVTEAAQSGFAITCQNYSLRNCIVTYQSHYGTSNESVIVSQNLSNQWSTNQNNVWPVTYYGGDFCITTQAGVTNALTFTNYTDLMGAKSVNELGEDIDQAVLESNGWIPLSTMSARTNGAVLGWMRHDYRRTARNSSSATWACGAIGLE